MPTYQTSGIVIGRTNFGEADRIIRLFTPDHGKLSVVAKGVRRIKSRAAGHLEPFGEVNLVLASGRGSLDVVTSARLSWYPHNLSADYHQLEAAFNLSVIVDRLTEPGQSHPKAYQALSGLLHALDERGISAQLELWYKLHVLDALGYRPELRHCLQCGYSQADRQFHFDASRGGIICERCDSDNLPVISIPAIKLWRLMCDFPFTSIVHLADCQPLAEATLPYATAFLEYHAIA